MSGLSSASNRDEQAAASLGDVLVRGIHNKGGSDEYRPKRDDESWFAWWQGYQAWFNGEGIEVVKP
jgi:hypothetical protein